jgi:predicted RNA-binding protein YlqC (UPF0109 family)
MSDADNTIEDDDDDFEDDDDDFEDDDDDDDDDDLDGDRGNVVDEVGAEGNRISGARAKTVIELVARQLVDDPDGVFVDATERSNNVAILIHTSPGDLGRIIGKRGRVIQALRQVGRAAGSADGVKVTVEVAE